MKELDNYQIKDALDNSLNLKYSRYHSTQYVEFYLSSLQYSSLGYIINQYTGYHPDDTETFYSFFKSEDGDSKIWQEMSDIMDASGMKELKCSDPFSRLFKVENMDDLMYIINGLEGIIEDFK
jgi:hypothetical protein